MRSDKTAVSDTEAEAKGSASLQQTTGYPVVCCRTVYSCMHCAGGYACVDF